MADAKQQQAAAAAAAADAQRAQQLAESSRAVLAGLERALDAREAKLHDSWKALRSQLAALGGGSGSEGGSGALLHSDARLREDAQAAALDAAGRSATPLPSVSLDSAASAELVKVRLSILVVVSSQ